MRLQIQVTIHVDLKKKQSDKKLYPYLHIKNVNFDVTGLTDHESKNQILYLKYKICY